MDDITIARDVIKEDIRDIGKKIGLLEDDLILYGKFKAKIKEIDYKPKGNLILVTAISPTPYGEGKTTVSVGLVDALNRLNKKAIAVLRQPSMGPVFGMKGGATGGGFSQVVPMEDINLHFTGDFHAITTANNLLCAAIDNHIYFGNQLDIQEVVFHRCLDVNDRALRCVNLGNREEHFSITAASEIMALFCLADSFDDLKKRLGDIIIGYNSKGKMIYARELNIEGSLAVILKEAFLPNLVQTLEGNPAIIHGGPFANIAHGCNSIVATKTGLTLGDFVVTEAGFGADLGAEKFLDIKCRKMSISPKVVVLVATIKALKYHGGVEKEKIHELNTEALRAGLPNLIQHIDNLKKYGIEVVVCLNKYSNDREEEIALVKECCDSIEVEFAVSTAYLDGGKGALTLADKVVDACFKDKKINYLYADNVSLKEKIKIISKEIYRSNDVKFSESALEKIAMLEENNLTNLPICVAKTQYSFSDDAKKRGVPKDFSIFVRDVLLYNGAGFITILLGNIMTMPGLSKMPNYIKIDCLDGEIVGLN